VAKGEGGEMMGARVKAAVEEGARGGREEGVQCEDKSAGNKTNEDAAD
jgi:hypothetical protein